jgi:hypothetical protein
MLQPGKGLAVEYLVEALGYSPEKGSAFSIDLILPAVLSLWGINSLSNRNENPEYSLVRG